MLHLCSGCVWPLYSDLSCFQVSFCVDRSMLLPVFGLCYKISFKREPIQNESELNVVKQLSCLNCSVRKMAAFAFIRLCVNAFVIRLQNMKSRCDKVGMDKVGLDTVVERWPMLNLSQSYEQLAWVLESKIMPNKCVIFFEEITKMGHR